MIVIFRTSLKPCVIRVLEWRWHFIDDYKAEVWEVTAVPGMQECTRWNVEKHMMPGWRHRELWVFELKRQEQSRGLNVGAGRAPEQDCGSFSCPHQWAPPPRWPSQEWPPGCVCSWTRSRRSCPLVRLYSGYRWVRHSGSAWGSPGLHSWRASVGLPDPEGAMTDQSVTGDMKAMTASDTSK